MKKLKPIEPSQWQKHYLELAKEAGLELSEAELFVASMSESDKTQKIVGQLYKRLKILKGLLNEYEYELACVDKAVSSLEKRVGIAQTPNTPSN